MIGQRPAPHAGLRHVALFVARFEETVRFYIDLLGFVEEWTPDPDNVYLCSGNDNLALHRLPDGRMPDGIQRLDHIALILNSPAEVDTWHEYLQAHDVKIRTTPRTHRDGARSFYCEDPGGNVVQMIYHPPLAG